MSCEELDFKPGVLGGGLIVDKQVKIVIRFEFQEDSSDAGRNDEEGWRTESW